MFVLGNKENGLFIKRGASRYSQMAVVKDKQKARVWPTRVGPAQTIASLRQNPEVCERLFAGTGINIDTIRAIPVFLTFKNEDDAEK